MRTVADFVRWVGARVTVADDDIGRPTFDECRTCFSAAGLEAADSVLIALPSGAGYLNAVAAALEAGLRPILGQASIPSGRMEELALALGATAVFTGRASPSSPSGFSVRRIRTGQRMAEVSQGDIVLLTSGTSGNNSGCVCSFSRLVLNAGMHADSIHLEPSDRLLAVLPLSSSFGFVAQALAAFSSDASLVIAPTPFSPNVFMRTLREQSISVASLTPFLVRPVVELPRDRFPSSLRVLSVGGDHLPRTWVETLLRIRPDGELYLTYGLTEAGPRVSTLAAHAEQASRLTSVGRPLPGITAWLDHQSEDGSGPLALRTPTASLARVGSVDDPNATRLDPQSGIIRTGDVFRIDDDGYLHFQGRSSDFILQAGDKICLASIRRRAEALSGVRKAGTTVFADGHDAKRYRLVLHAEEPDSAALQVEIQKLLRALRISERPFEIHCLPASSLTSFK